MLLLLVTLLALLLLLVESDLLVSCTLLLGRVVDSVQGRLKSALSDGFDGSLVHELATTNVSLAVVLTAQLSFFLRLLAGFGSPLVHLGLGNLASTLEDSLIHVVHRLVHVALGSSEKSFAVGFLLLSLDISHR